MNFIATASWYPDSPPNALVIPAQNRDFVAASGCDRITHGTRSETCDY